MYINKSNIGKLGRYNLELSNIIEGTDIFNSAILYLITKIPDSIIKIESITKLGINASNLASDKYGTHMYSWLLIILNSNLDNFNYKLGDKVRYVEKTDLFRYLNNALM